MHRSSSSFGAAGLLGVALSLSCCSNSGYGDAPGASGLQVSITRTIGPPSPEVRLLVVDDRADAADLIEAVGNSLDTLSAHELEPQTGCALAEDPAAFHPIDWSVVIVHPSATGDAIYTSPADDPALRWSANQRTEAARRAWLDAVKAALTALPPELGPFAALEAFQRSTSLLARQREPESARERALVASVPTVSAIAVSVVLAHDDESPGAPADYAHRETSDTFMVLDSIAVPAAEPATESVSCRFANGAAAPRLAEWLTAQHASEWALWPCEGLELFPKLSADLNCDRQCVDFRPLVEDDGSAACLVLVDSAQDSCDENLGWLDPQADDGTRRPVLTHTATGTVRTCEIRQLTGPALTSCSSDLSCADCEPGWCLTQVPELHTVCSKNRPLPVRFVGGSDVVANGLATVICNAQR